MTQLPSYSVQTILAITGARIYEQLKLVCIMCNHVIIEQLPISSSLDLTTHPCSTYISKAGYNWVNTHCRCVQAATDWVAANRYEINR